MFKLYSETELTSLGGGLSRRILAHDNDMMVVEVLFRKAPSALCTLILTFR